MPAVIFPGPEGRLEGRFSPAPRPRAPVAMILHPHPQGGGTMNDRITQALYKTFQRRGFATLRFNFRGVGRSQGTFDNGRSEEHTSELQSLMRISYAVFCLQKKKKTTINHT